MAKSEDHDLHAKQQSRCEPLPHRAHSKDRHTSLSSHAVWFCIYDIGNTWERDIATRLQKTEKWRKWTIKQTKKELLHSKNADQNQNSQKQKPRAKTYYIKEKKQSFFFFFFPVRLCRGVTSVQIGATSCCCCRRDDAGSFLRKENDRMRGGDDDDDEDDARRRPGLLQHSTTIITFVPRLRAYTLWIKVTTKRLQQVHDSYPHSFKLSNSVQRRWE